MDHLLSSDAPIIKVPESQVKQKQWQVASGKPSHLLFIAACHLPLSFFGGLPLL
jgi:hypothetical protein